MTCRHGPGDTNCSKYGGGYSYDTEPKTPDASKYSIEKAERIGEHLVLKVNYPNCKRCSYEGNKIMVFLNVSELAALKWKKIDPHFRDPKIKRETEAPTPAARFPASDEGWEDAIWYATKKAGKA